jgi:hypothetical protein
MSLFLFLSLAFLPLTDTITPPPPPGGPLGLAGPSSACVGQTSEYTTEVPLACICQWYVNEILQPDTLPVFSILWTQPGIQDVSAAFLCSDGGLSDPETISVSVYALPQPTPIEGQTLVCEYAYHYYSTEVGPGDSCQWKVNGIIQPGFAPSINYSFGGAGNYWFEVLAYNPCGTSNPQTLAVTAAGTVPYVFLGNDTTIMPNQTLLLDAGNPGCEYLWSTGATTQTIVVSISGIYSVTVTNNCGSDEDAIEVTVLVGTEEIALPADCPLSAAENRVIRFRDLPPGPCTIQVFGLSGSVVYNGRAIDQINIPGPGIYVVRVLADGFICQEKIFSK